LRRTSFDQLGDGLELSPENPASCPYGERSTGVKILVTGAAGQLGRCLARTLAAHEMVALGHAALDITRFDAVRDAVALHRPRR
jgi:FlaA1/EpsC-like NDP-sugar epimerase